MFELIDITYKIMINNHSFHFIYMIIFFIDIIQNNYHKLLYCTYFSLRKTCYFNFSDETSNHILRESY
jgi:hypothetical protein